jgi:hypothetical protein
MKKTKNRGKIQKVLTPKIETKQEKRLQIEIKEIYTSINQQQQIHTNKK